MKWRARWLCGFAASLALWGLDPAPALGTVRANLRMLAISGGCFVNDQEDPFQGEPERYFRMGVFDDASPATLGGCRDGCADDLDPLTHEGATLDYCSVSTGCGAWNFVDQSLVKVLPPQQGAFFYFGLFDEDVLDGDDSLGDHWLSTSDYVTAIMSPNNDASPYEPGEYLDTACGRHVELTGPAGNYNLECRIWFTDDTPPSDVPTPVHYENEQPSAISYDGRLDFRWEAATDLDSGIAGYTFDLRDVTVATYVFYDHPAPLSGIMSICPSSCWACYSPIHQHTYELRVRAHNGRAPRLTDESGTGASGSTVSAPVQVQVQLTAAGVDSVQIVGPSRWVGRPSPNPFSNSTRIAYALRAGAAVRIAVFDILGSRKRVVRDGWQGDGDHVAWWDGRDESGRPAPAGIYVLRLECGGQSLSQRLILVR